LKTIVPYVGDHVVIIAEITGSIESPKVIRKRDWRSYSKDLLLLKLESVQFITNCDNPQDLWNNFEMSLLPIIDEVVPYAEFLNNSIVNHNSTPPYIKNKINTRKRLLRKLKTSKSNELNKRVRNLNLEIRNFFTQKKRNSIQRAIVPGNSKSLWTAVKMSKNASISNIPTLMFCDNIPVPQNEVPNAFADYFESKIAKITNETIIDPNVYNGKRKMFSSDQNFMSENEILIAVKSLSVKNSEGHDRIPQRILIDGYEILKAPLLVLFNKIYETKEIPQQWLISKVNPILKKGNPSNIENYRPISNLCSTSKIFEKLILLRMQSLEKLNKIDLTGKAQHGFKRKHSTTTAGLTLQSLLARALNDDKFAIMSSLDLSAAFDVVNIELLLKRLKIIGLPDDLLTLINNWLTERYFYVSVEGLNSFVHTSNVGTVQGSILGPILYAIFVSPLFDLANMTLFADDNYVIHWNSDLSLLIVDMQRTIELITKWLRQSGLKVNDGKTEVCLFHRKDHPTINITFNSTTLRTKQSMNVLGILFDSKMQWQPQVQLTINKSKRALQAIKLIRKYFSREQLLKLITACYYSILYYNSEIWLLPTLNPQSKRKLLSASAAPLKLITRNYDRSMSFESLHFQNKRATPTQMTLYKHALLFHKTYNDESMSRDWTDMFFNQQFNNRATTAKFYNTSNFKVGNNILSNRFVILNSKIPLEWLNESMLSFKIHCKRLFLQ
jgi:hypothetical protein